MSNRKFSIAVVLCLITLALHVQFALAHEEITIGDYTVEVGWRVEPPVVGVENAIILHVVAASDGHPVEDISGLTLTVSYGGQEKRLALQAVGKGSLGEYRAPIFPTLPGQYTVLLGGTLGDTAVDAHMEPEEVEPGDSNAMPADESLRFPNVNPAAQSAGTGDELNWLLYAGIAVGLIVLLFSVYPIRVGRR